MVAYDDWAWLATARQGLARHGKARPGLARFGAARHGRGSGASLGAPLAFSQ